MYPIIFIPGEDTGGLNEEGMHINPGDLIITGSADHTARSWSLDAGYCLKVSGQWHEKVTGNRLVVNGQHHSKVAVSSTVNGQCHGHVLVTVSR